MYPANFPALGRGPFLSLMQEKRQKKIKPSRMAFPYRVREGKGRRKEPLLFSSELSHLLDKAVFDAGGDGRYLEVSAARGREGDSHPVGGLGVVAAEGNMERAPEGEATFGTAQLADLVRQLPHVLGTYFEQGVGIIFDDPPRCVYAQQSAGLDQSDAITANGLVHVRRRNKHRDPLSLEATQHVPELVSRNDIDTRSRFV